LTSLSTAAQPIRVTGFLDEVCAQGQVATTAVVVLTVVLTIVLTVVLTVVLSIVLTVVVASLAELSLSNAGCKQHGQNCGETHDDEVVGMEYPVVEKVRVVKE
jgi:hypothetical protein